MRKPSQSFGRRVRRLLLSPPVIIPLAAIAVVVIGFFDLLLDRFSGRIDNLLKGEVFTRSAGIYAAPKQLHVGQAISQDQLLEFFERVRATLRKRNRQTKLAALYGQQWRR